MKAFAVQHPFAPAPKMMFAHNASVRSSYGYGQGGPETSDGTPAALRIYSYGGVETSDATPAALRAYGGGPETSDATPAALRACGGGPETSDATPAALRCCIRRW